MQRASIDSALTLTWLLCRSLLSQHDRQWMIVDAETLKACTARSDPEVRGPWLLSKKNKTDDLNDLFIFLLPDGAH